MRGLSSLKIVLESLQELLLRLALQMARDDYEDRRERQRARAWRLRRKRDGTPAARPTQQLTRGSLRCALRGTASPIRPGWPAAAKARLSAFGQCGRRPHQLDRDAGRPHESLNHGGRHLIAGLRFFFDAFAWEVIR